ncbi:DUF4276 family protein [uncultured Gammaproteobacteria bacterium]
MARIVFMVEEPSIKVFLDKALPRFFPTMDFLCIPHQGKQDLEKSLPRKLKGWTYPEDRFVVIRDKDRDDCVGLKQSLVTLCAKAGRPDTLVRIACHELEAWYIGDPAGMATAFASPALAAIAKKKKFRNPDIIQKPSLEIKILYPGFQKIRGARSVADHLSYTRNNSKSFRILIEGLARITQYPVPTI